LHRHFPLAFELREGNWRLAYNTCVWLASMMIRRKKNYVNDCWSVKKRVAY